MNKIKRLHILLLFWFLCLSAQAQLLSGVVTDAETRMVIPSVTVSYRGHNVAVASGIDGRYVIQKHVEWALTFSAVGYVPQTIMIVDRTPVKPGYPVEARHQTVAERDGTLKASALQP